MGERSDIVLERALAWAREHASDALRPDAGHLRALVDAWSDPRRTAVELSTVVDAIPVLVSYVDASERYRLVNRAYESWFGRPREELVGAPLREVLGEAAYEAVRPVVRAALEGHPQRIETELPYRHGGTRWVEVTFSPDVDASGRVLGYVALVQDIGARKKDEAARAASLERERALTARLEAAHARVLDLVAQLPAMIAVTAGPEHRFELVSPALAALFGHATVVGRTVREAADVLGGSRDSLAAYDRVYRTGEPETLRETLTIATAAGPAKPRVFDVTLTPRRAADGTVEGVLAMVSEATERVRVEARQALLLEASRMLAGPLDVQTALERLAELLVPRLGDNVTVSVVDDDGTIRQVAERADDPEREALLRAMREKRPLPGGPSATARVVATGQTVFVPRIDPSMLERAACDPEHLDLLRRVEARAAIAVPLVAQGRVLGAIALGVTTSLREWDEADVALAEELGRRAGVAVAHARDHQALRAAREREAFLGEATRVLSESLDPDATLRRIAELAVPALADWCVVSELAADGTLRDAAHATSDPEHAAWLARAAERREVPSDAVAAVLAGGDAPPPILRFDDAASAATSWPARTKIVVPLRRGGRPLGVLRLAMSRSEREHAPWQRDLAVELASRAAVALDNARLYRETHAAATAAQRAHEALDAVVRASPLAVMLLELDGTVVMWNPAAERIFGWSADEVVGRFLPAVAPADREALLARLAEVASGRPIASFEGPRLRRDGTFDAQIWAAAVHGGRGVQVLSIVADVGERKRLDAAVAASARRLAVIAEVSRTFAEAGLEPELATRAIVRIVAEQLGDAAALCLVTPEGTELERVAQFHQDPARDAEAEAAFVARFPIEGSLIGEVVRTGRPLRFDAAAVFDQSRVLTDAGRRYLERVGVNQLMVVPLRVHGTVLGTLGVSRERPRPFDDDELELLEEIAHRAAFVIDNVRLYRTAQDATRLRDEFLATVSHELRTPLNALVGWTQLVRDKAQDTALVQRALETIHRNAMLQAKLVDDLLDVSRIITGKLRLDRRPLDPEVPVRAAVDVLASAAQARRIELRVEIAPDLGELLADPARLQQITWNLVSNAVKFSTEGGMVRISLERAQDELVLAVQDEGAGFEPSFARHLFERFRQANATPGTGRGGLGLGLSIVRHLVELHGGRVHASSEGPGRGARFEVKIPLRGEALVEDACESPAAVVARPVGRAAVSLEGLRVLLVEDDADTREAMRIALAARGAEVVTAGDGRAALAQLDRAVPDIVVSDVAMPHLDGYGLLRALRQRPSDRGGAVPAIAVTAFARPEDTWRARDAGFSTHVAKPVDGAALVAVVAELCGR